MMKRTYKANKMAYVKKYVFFSWKYGQRENTIGVYTCLDQNKKKRTTMPTAIFILHHCWIADK